MLQVVPEINEHTEETKMPEKKTSNLKSRIAMSIEKVIGKNVIF